MSNGQWHCISQQSKMLKNHITANLNTLYQKQQSTSSKTNVLKTNSSVIVEAYKNVFKEKLSSGNLSRTLWSSFDTKDLTVKLTVS